MSQPTDRLNSSTLIVQVSGSTATVAAITGWEVLIANVGDSCAYLDTGVEVILVHTYSAPFNGACAEAEKSNLLI